jgi:hypothetical protein
MRVDADDNAITFKFITRTGATIDTYTVGSASTQTQTQTLIGPGATWKYLDNGSDQGTAWRATSFSDTAWKSGAAQLGYGDGDEKTIVGYGPDGNNRFVTTYFRRSFNVTDAAAVSALNLQLVRDDGAVVYLNGAEVYRSNMPSGTIGYSTLASTTIGGTDESAWNPAAISKSALLTGNNVIAVEIHQSVLDSSDISFDFQLTSTATNTLTAMSTTLAKPASTTFSSTSISPTASFLVDEPAPLAGAKKPHRLDDVIK